MLRPYSEAVRLRSSTSVSKSRDRLVRDLQKPVRLGHFSGAGVLAARGAIDQQDGGAALVGMAPLGSGNPGAGVEPVDREVVVGVREFGAGLARVRALAAVRVGVPRRSRDLVELGGERPERGVLKPIQEPLAELALAQARAWHSLARREVRHLRLLAGQRRGPAPSGMQAAR
jgi:hypothetical protein